MLRPQPQMSGAPVGMAIGEEPSGRKVVDKEGLHVGFLMLLDHAINCITSLEPFDGFQQLRLGSGQGRKWLAPAFPKHQRSIPQHHHSAMGCLGFRRRCKA